MGFLVQRIELSLSHVQKVCLLCKGACPRRDKSRHAAGTGVEVWSVGNDVVQVKSAWEAKV